MEFVLAALLSVAAQQCEQYTITGYIQGSLNPYTYDGTSVWTSEPIAAASWNVPMGSIIEVYFPWGVEVYRVADRGRLGARHIDVQVPSLQAARNRTGTYTVCIRY